MALLLLAWLLLAPLLLFLRRKELKNNGSTHLVSYEEFSFQFFIPACHLPGPEVVQVLSLRRRNSHQGCNWLIVQNSQISGHLCVVHGLLRCTYIELGQALGRYWIQFVRIFGFFLFAVLGDWHIKLGWNQLCLQMAHKICVSGSCFPTC